MTMTGRTLLLGALLGGAALTFAPHAHAQVDRQQHYDSPQHFAIELRLGLYYPKVDNEFAEGVTPFEDSFGRNQRLFVGTEFDWQAFRIPWVGTIGPGVGVHYLKFGRPALLGDGSPSEEDTSLLIYPMHLVGVLRIDVLARETRIPLVPYLKGGFGMALWRMTNGGGTSKVTHDETDASGVTRRYTDAKGKGVSYGPQFSLGLALQLDWFDEYAASQADQTLGINNTYIYAEYMSSHLNNLNGTGLQLGTNSLAFGLAFEF